MPEDDEAKPGTKERIVPQDDDQKYVSRAEYERLRKDYDQTFEALSEQVAANDALQARVTALEPLEQQVGDLTAKSRSLEAARMYDKVATELKVKPEFRDDVFKLADLKLDGEPDEKAVKDHFAKFLSERKHYTEGDKEKKHLQKDEHAGRGAKDPGFGDGDAKPTVTSSQLRDPEWTKSNAKLLQSMEYELVEA